MKIGLVRHFKVKHAYSTKLFIHYDELIKWFNEYEQADIEYRDIDMCGVRWDKCYSSSLPRALRTAQHLFEGEIEEVETLKELDFAPLLNKRLNLPLFLWAFLIRKKILSNALSTGFPAEISAFVDSILRGNSQNVLICSHGFVLMFLQQELRRRGFTGPNFKTPLNGKLYLFQAGVSQR